MSNTDQYSNVTGPTRELHELLERLKCAHCRAVLKDARVLPCGCRFCRACLEQLLASGAHCCPGGAPQCGGTPLSTAERDDDSTRSDSGVRECSEEIEDIADETENRTHKSKFLLESDKEDSETRESVARRLQMMASEMDRASAASRRSWWSRLWPWRGDTDSEHADRTNAAPGTGLSLLRRVILDMLHSGEMGTGAEVRRIAGLVEHIECENKSIREENKPIKEENKAIREENRAIKEENKAIKEENRAIKEENKPIQEENKSIREEIKSIKEENKAIKEENKAIKEENRAIKEENRAIKEEIKSIKEENKSIKEENKAIKEENKARKEENRAIKEENRAIRDEVESIKADMECRRAHAHPTQESVRAPEGAGRGAASCDEWVLEDAIGLADWASRESASFSGPAPCYSYLLESANSVAEGALRVHLLIAAGPHDALLDWPLSAAVTLSVAGRGRPGARSGHTRLCRIERPPDGRYRCRHSAPFEFPHAALRAAGLHMSEGVRVSCQIVPAGDQ